MTTTAVDGARRDLTAAIASILRLNGCGSDVAALVAAEVVAAMLGRGWRPAPAGLPATLRPVPEAQKTPAAADAPGAAEYRAARAAHIHTPERHTR